MILFPRFGFTRAALIFLTIGLLRQSLLAQAYSPAADPFVQMRTNTGETMMPQNDRRFDYTNREYDNITPIPTLFLPPLPPIIGELSRGSWEARVASGFAANIDRETFYAAYTYLASLNEAWANEIDRVVAYQNAGQPLLRDLRATLEKTANGTPAERAEALSKLAQQQDGPLRALAADAEGIRLKLAGSTAKLERGHLAGKALVFDASTEATLQLLFASSFYAGLSPEQRRLLPEIAAEQATPLRKEGQEWTSGAALFFIPDTARLQPPANLPSELETKLRAFVREKQNVKSELRTAVLRNYFFVSSRTRRLTELAQQQAPRFAALETLAEEIRVGLAQIGFPDHLESAALPADLTERVGNFYKRKVEARRELLGKLRELRAEHPTSRFEIRREGDGLAIVEFGVAAKAKASLTAFNANEARRYTAFAHESETLRDEIQQHLAKSPQRTTRTVDQLAADFAKAYVARENSQLYGDYIRSVLEPGLSPAQRRLLFQAATADLEQTSGAPQP